jgi:hypothetical protein
MNTLKLNAKLTEKQIEVLANGLAKQMLNQPNFWNDEVANTLPQNCISQQENKNGELEMFVLLANVMTNFANANDVVTRASFMVQLQNN